MVTFSSDRHVSQFPQLLLSCANQYSIYGTFLVQLPFSPHHSSYVPECHADASTPPYIMHHASQRGNVTEFSTLVNVKIPQVHNSALMAIATLYNLKPLFITFAVTIYSGTYVHVSRPSPTDVSLQHREYVYGQTRRRQPRRDCARALADHTSRRDAANDRHEVQPTNYGLHHAVRDQRERPVGWDSKIRHTVVRPAARGTLCTRFAGTARSRP